MLMSKGVQVVQHSRRRQIFYDICCLVSVFFSLLDGIVHNLRNVMKTLNFMKNRSHLYSVDRYAKCDVRTVAEITNRPNVICYF